MSLLRGKRLAKMDAEAVRFTSSAEKDSPLLKHVVKINLAHVVSLYKDKIIGHEEASSIVKALKSIPEDLQLDSFLEDVHMNVESFVLCKAGVAGGLMNVGKSRNDQVSTALRMITREYLLSIVDEILRTVKIFINIASNNVNKLMPGYTHLQIAQPTTVAHYLACYAEALARDGKRFKDLYRRTNISPMGSAAFAGSTVPLNRQRVARLLGFEGILMNTMDAVSTRDFLLEFLSAATITQIDLSRFAEDMIFYSTHESKYIIIPDSFASTSSMMPQKKNAVVLETIRAKASSLIGMLSSAASNIKGQPQAYNLDLQDLNSLIWVAGDTVKDSLRLVRKMITGTRFDEVKLTYGANAGHSLATDLAEILCIDGKIPFRDAHHIVGAAIKKGADGSSDYQILRKLIANEAEAAGYKGIENTLPLNYDAMYSVNRRKGLGSPNPALMKEVLKYQLRDAEELQDWLKKKYQFLSQCSSKLEEDIEELEKEVRKNGV